MNGLVLKFASMIRDARYIRDTVVDKIPKCGEPQEGGCLSLKDQFFPLSFSSKFLHFHFPKLVFIFDSITWNCLCPAKRFCRHFNEDSSFVVYLPSGCTGNSSGSMAEDIKYYDHTAKEYELAKEVFRTFSNDKTLLEALELGMWGILEKTPFPATTALQE